MSGLFKRLAAALIVLALFASPGFADRIGILASEGDGDPSNTYAYAMTFPNGTISIVNGVLTYTPAVVAGDVTGVGDCASGACGDGTSDGGTYYRLYDGTANYLQLAVSGALGGNLTLNLDTLLTTGSPQFTAIELGHATDTTIARSGAGAITVEGTAVLLSGGDAGTPSAIVLTNGTGLPVATGISGLGANVATFLATPSEANLYSALTDVSLFLEDLVDDTTPSLGGPLDINNQVIFDAANAFTLADATPDVSGGTVFKTADTTTYTDFDDGTDHTSFQDGRMLVILAQHAAALDCSASQINCNEGADLTLADGDVVTCFFDDTTDADGQWLCSSSNDNDTGGATAYNSIGDPSASGSISFGANTGTYTSSTDGWGGLIVESTVANNASPTTLMTLQFADANDSTNNSFLKIIEDSDGTPVTLFEFKGRSLTLGTNATIDGIATITASTAVNPQSADGATLGTAALEWSDLYLADGAVIYGQNDQSNTLTSSATGWVVGLDLTISGDDLIMGTNTDAYMLIADGTSYNPVAISGDIAVTNAGVTTIQANAVDSSMINTIVDSVFWDSGGMVSDGTQCADAAKVTINSGPAQYTVICASSDASTLYGHVVMPDSWDGGNVTFELEYLQTAADTNAMNSDITAMCRGATETVNNTWASEVAIDDAAVTGSNAVDHTTSAAITPNGTCAGGDTLYWRWQLDATGTTTAVATLHILGVKMEYTSNVGD